MKSKRRFITTLVIGAAISFGGVSCAYALGAGIHIVNGVIFSCTMPTPTTTGLSNCKVIGTKDRPIGKQ